MTAFELTEQITIRDKTDGVVNVRGLTVAPGLAVTQPRARDGEPVERRYSITHIPSGYALPDTEGGCADRIRTVLDVVVASGIDWTRDRELVVADANTQGLAATLLATAGRITCKRLFGCPGDPDEPEAAQVRCNTCGWDWDDEHHEEPLTVEKAKRLARSHECEPDVRIALPGSGTWYQPSSVKDDGTVV